MDIKYSEYLPDPSLSREEMIEMQRNIAEKSINRDQNIDGRGFLGVDQSFPEQKVVSAAVLMNDHEPLRKLYSVNEPGIPYIPGLLSYREGGAVVNVLEDLDTTPNYILFDGSGYIHPRMAGLATHIGVVFDVPTIGVAKNLLCGSPQKPMNEPLEEGVRVPIVADDSVEAPNGKLLGYAYQSRQYESSDLRINPIYVSPGHRMSAETAVQVVREACDEHKLPEPIHYADKYADRIKKEYTQNTL